MMDDNFLYNRIAEDVRQDILDGRLQPGDRLPSIRDLTSRWNCTPGTIQRAYQELAHQGLVISQAGKGTHVSGQLDPSRIQAQVPLRRAQMVHRAEAFLLESITAGYDLREIQQALNLAMDRWRTLQAEEAVVTDPGVIRFSGSHDLALIWMAEHFDTILPGVNLKANFTGSLGGLMALAGGRATLAGCHLWDAETSRYNEPFIAKLFPGKHMVSTRLANRRIGLITAPENPLNLRRVEDLLRPGVRFVNRQSGSGTRVWLDATLQQLGLDAEKIIGYGDEKLTHSEVARCIAEGSADVGVGLASSASAFGLGFEFLVEECYDLVTYAAVAEAEPVSGLFNWLASQAGKAAIASLKGYDATHTGEKTVYRF
jgi:molybdate-binding protein/DNA-binding transcriptional regulator YhcF (GntR family)